MSIDMEENPSKTCIACSNLVSGDSNKTTVLNYNHRYSLLADGNIGSTLLASSMIVIVL